MWLQVSLVVNVASECGFTEEHYKDLQKLQRDFGPYHFNVLAFPCNQFGQQEPGSDKEIDSFVRRVYGVSFPLFSKIAVVGTGANNVYKYLVGKFCFKAQLLLNWTLIFHKLNNIYKDLSIKLNKSTAEPLFFIFLQSRLGRSLTGISGSISLM